MIRLNKYLSEAGIWLQKRGRPLIEAGQCDGGWRAGCTWHESVRGAENMCREKSDPGCRTEGCSGSQQTGRYRVYRGYESEK